MAVTIGIGATVEFLTGSIDAGVATPALVIAATSCTVGARRVKTATLLILSAIRNRDAKPIRAMIGTALIGVRRAITVDFACLRAGVVQAGDQRRSTYQTPKQPFERRAP